MKVRPGCTGTRLEMLSGDSEYFADYGDDADEVVAGEFEEEQDLDDEPREMSSSWRKTTVKTEDCRDTAQDGKPWVPTRVASALKGAKDFAEFKAKREFTFLHTGEQDVLGDALLRLAGQAGIKVKVMALDRDRDGMDLTGEEPFGDLLDMARTGQFDRSHAGFPCGSFSKVRHRPGTGPPFVRLLEFIYGLPTNSQRQQAEADRGSLLAMRSTQITAEVIQCQRLRRVPGCGTLENPPGSEDRLEGPAWCLPRWTSS